MTDVKRLAVVTGGSSGIGLSAGEYLIEAGYDVVLTARNPVKLKSAADLIGARCFAVDATDEERMSKVMAELGHVDLLVHSAGVFGAKSIRKQTLEEFRALVDVNLSSAYVACRASLPYMGEGGRIILVGSTSGVDGHAWLTAYAASKAGVRMMAESLRGEVEKDGISVTVLTLPTVDTPMMEEIARPAILVDDCSKTIVWLDSMHPRVRIPEVVLRSADDSPVGHHIAPSVNAASVPA